MPDHLDEERSQRQAELQEEAGTATANLCLVQAMSAVGEPMTVGSAALGLMVWRDLDVTVVCRELEAATVARLGAGLAIHPRVREVLFRHDTGRWNVDTEYPDGRHLGLHYRTGAGNDWKIDVWFVDEPERQPDLAHARSLPPRLTPTTRAAILRIKDTWCKRPEYGKAVRSYDIYPAVLDDHLRTPEQFAQWLQRRTG